MPPFVNTSGSSFASDSTEFEACDAQDALQESSWSRRLPTATSNVELMPVAGPSLGADLDATVTAPRLAESNELTAKAPSAVGKLVSDVVDRVESIGKEFALTSAAFQEVGERKALAGEQACKSSYRGGQEMGASTAEQTGLGLSSGVCSGGVGIVVGSIFGLPALAAHPIETVASTAKAWSGAAEEFLTTADFPRQVQMLATGVTEFLPGLFGVKNASRAGVPVLPKYREVHGELMPRGELAARASIRTSKVALPSSTYALAPEGLAMPAGFGETYLSAALRPAFESWGMEDAAVATWSVGRDVLSEEGFLFGSEAGSMGAKVAEEGAGEATTGSLASDGAAASGHAAEPMTRKQVEDTLEARRLQYKKLYEVRKNDVVDAAETPAKADRAASKSGLAGDILRIFDPEGVMSANELVAAAKPWLLPLPFRDQKATVLTLKGVDRPQIEKRLSLSTEGLSKVYRRVFDGVSDAVGAGAPPQPVRPGLLGITSSKFATFLTEGTPDQQRQRLAIVLNKWDDSSFFTRTELSFMGGVLSADFGTSTAQALGTSRSQLSWVDGRVTDRLRSVDDGSFYAAQSEAATPDEATKVTVGRNPIVRFFGAGKGLTEDEVRSKAQPFLAALRNDNEKFVVQQSLLGHSAEEIASQSESMTPAAVRSMTTRIAAKLPAIAREVQSPKVPSPRSAGQLEVENILVQRKAKYEARVSPTLVPKSAKFQATGQLARPNLIETPRGPVNPISQLFNPDGTLSSSEVLATAKPWLGGVPAREQEAALLHLRGFERLDIQAHMFVGRSGLTDIYQRAADKLRLDIASGTPTQVLPELVEMGKSSFKRFLTEGPLEQQERRLALVLDNWDNTELFTDDHRVTMRGLFAGQGEKQVVADLGKKSKSNVSWISDQIVARLRSLEEGAPLLEEAAFAPSGFPFAVPCLNSTPARPIEPFESPRRAIE